MSGLPWTLVYGLQFNIVAGSQLEHVSTVAMMCVPLSNREYGGKVLRCRSGATGFTGAGLEPSPTILVPGFSSVKRRGNGFYYHC